MKIKNTLFLIAITSITLFGCKKTATTPEEEVKTEAKASAGPLAVFQKSTASYQLYVYRYDETTATWTRRIGSHFSTVSDATPTAMGFTNPYVEDSGVNMFQMVTLYTDQLGTNNIKEAKINAPAVLEFYPSAENATKGIVKVIKQDVTLTVKAGGSFKIGISGEGTYDETTKLIDLVVKFNETAIGGASEVKRTYKLSVDALTL
ncbi:hypothetical protein [Pedobacter aquatilis]|uniref:hypothetical protein n=1 Tax=Pedobacter aquatilis TaxID=351343 RepID=UPI00292DC0A2|nr:hypothetical protein [Pedobacter aquatilis]